MKYKVFLLLHTPRSIDNYENIITKNSQRNFHLHTIIQSINLLINNRENKKKSKKKNKN